MRDDVYVSGVKRKCECLLKAGVWARDKVRPYAWLNNFPSSEEQAVAAVLLDNFIYYSDELTDRLLRGAYARLKDTLGKELERAVFTPVQGEKPRPTDSGHIICRKVRQVLAVEDSRIMAPEDALVEATTGRPVVFVDDFLGSGDQMISTWKLSRAGGNSFAKLGKSAPPMYYMTLVTTEYGLGRCLAGAPAVEVVATHKLGQEYAIRSLINHPLAAPLPDLPDRVHDLLHTHSSALSLPTYMRRIDYPLYGYHSLGLTFAFEHSVPDASLPLLWSSNNSGWVPLAERT